MKKTIFLAIAVIALSLVSCEKEEPGGTATQSLAGDWVCTVYYSDGVKWNIYMGLDLLTYNTSANLSSEIWLDDVESFWGTLCKVNSNADNMTFGAKDSIYTDQYNDVGQKIWGGKVTPNGAVGPTGKNVDKIEYYIQFGDEEDDEGLNPYGTTFYVVGYRRTGFDEGNADQPKEDWTLPEVI